LSKLTNSKPEFLKIRTRIWLLPISVGMAFALCGVLSLVLSARSAASLQMLRHVDNPYLEQVLRVERGVERLRIAVQSAVAEGDPDRLKEAQEASVMVRKALDGMRQLDGKAALAAALDAAFVAYEADATAAARMLLGKEDAGEQLSHMQTTMRALDACIVEQQRAARAALEAQFSSVTDAGRLGQWASAITALLVLVGLAVGSRLIIGSVWRELEAVHNQLLATARLAGMAEIATNVLHNVGNVLNSVNVSAGIVSERLRSSKLKGLVRAVRLMDEHASDLGAFLTHDAKGKLLPGYLRELAPVLEAEHAGMADELGALSKSVDHIKEIVAAQQSYAGAPHIVESVKLDELLSEALRLNAGALTRHKVEVVTDIAELPELPLDRHRLLQIIVNLISNAKHALDGVTGRSPCIRLAAALVDARTLRISVGDNGEGIAPENLTRIFAHGFTTRKGGHGFGLHSCVVAAQEMGGRLSANSDGPGQGASFTLLLPIDTSEHSS
jgi:signal transduction histidine kinase